MSTWFVLRLREQEAAGVENSRGSEAPGDRTQFLLGAREECADGAGLNAHGFGDLGIAHAFGAQAETRHLTVAQGGGELTRKLGVLQDGLRVGTRVREEFQAFLDDLVLARGGFETVQNEITQDLVEPGMRMVDAPAVIALDEIAEEDFLHGVACLVGVAGQGDGIAKQTGAVEPMNLDYFSFESGGAGRGSFHGFDRSLRSGWGKHCFW
jgi:hypothetical protein